MLRLGQPSVPSPTPKQLEAEHPPTGRDGAVVTGALKWDEAGLFNGSLLASTGGGEKPNELLSDPRLSR